MNHSHNVHLAEGLRWGLGLDTRLILLRRLLDLNQERYAEELVAGLHKKKGPIMTKRKAPAADTPTLL